MPKQKLTDSLIRSFTTEKNREEISDTLKPGLVLRISANGNKTFVYRYRVGGKSKRYTIGKYPLVSLSKARSFADELYLKTKQEVDPQREKLMARHRDVLTIYELAHLYKKSHLPNLKETTADDYRRRIDNVIIPSLGDIEVEDLNRVIIIDFLSDIAETAPIQSNRVRAILSSMYSFGLKKALCDMNPVASVKPLSEENSRDRVYSEKEIQALWKAFETETEPFQQVLKMLLITGQRLGETRRMRWSDIHDNNWIIPETETKAKRVHVVPLSSYALEVLDQMKLINSNSEFVFQSPAKKNAPIFWLQHSSSRIAKQTNISDFRIHDLRRTAASFMAKLGVSRTVLGKVLNHKGLSGDSKVTSVYDRHEYLEEKRIALENWSIHLKGIISGAKTKATVYKIGS